MSYGVKLFTKFVEGRHDPHDKVWHGNEQAYKASDQMCWFLKEVSELERYRIVQN
jgi:hypothetical protein